MKTMSEYWGIIFFAENTDDVQTLNKLYNSCGGTVDQPYDSFWSYDGDPHMYKLKTGDEGFSEYVKEMGDRLSDCIMILEVHR